MSKLIAHLRAQWMGALALFLVIAGGTAYAANTIGSADIINGEVKSPDIGNNQVKSIDVRDDGQPEGGLGSVDIANDSLTGGDIADGSVGSGDVANESIWGADIQNETLSGSDVAADSLSGADIAESSLGKVPSAGLAGIGRWTGGGSCDPESTTYVDCAIVTLNLPQSARVLLIGQAEAGRELGANDGFGVCELVSNAGRIVPNSQVHVHTEVFGQSVGLNAVTPVQGAGSHDYAVDCAQGVDGAIDYHDVQISAVAISPD